MKTAVISAGFPEIIKALNRLHFETVEVKPYNNLYQNPEASHADMQILKIGSKIILLKNNDYINKIIISKTKNHNVIFTENQIDKFIYPDCVKLNVAMVGNNAIGNFKFTDKSVINILQDNRYNLINVKQGYAKCSTTVVSNEAIITSDNSIYHAVNGKLDCLKISEGYISLCEKYGGFIGGASFLLNNSTIAFTGDITAHPDYISIKSFCQNYGVNLLSLTNSPLCDVGGVVVL